MAMRFAAPDGGLHAIFAPSDPVEYAAAQAVTTAFRLSTREENAGMNSLVSFSADYDAMKDF